MTTHPESPFLAIYRDDVARIAGGIFHPRAPTSYNVVAPPGFSEDAVAGQIERALREAKNNALIACVSPDEVATDAAFVRLLGVRWEAPAAASTGDATTSELALERLVYSLPSSRPVVLLIKRFHKVLETTHEVFLARLRSLEEAGRLRTVTLSMYSHIELKQRWQATLGRKLVTSDYGDKHCTVYLRPLGPLDVPYLAMEYCAPEHVCQEALHWSGGFPEVFEQLVQQWLRVHATGDTLSTSTKREMRRLARERLARSVRYLDPPGETAARRAFLDAALCLGDGRRERALALLARHGWSNVILVSDGPTSGALLDAVIDSLGVSDGIGLSSLLYQSGQYDLAVDICSRIADPRATSMRNNAEIMSRITSEGVIDADWEGVARAVRAAESVHGLPAGLVERYSELRRIAAVAATAKADVIDSLMALGIGNEFAVRTALGILAARIRETTTANSGPTATVGGALSLPEQIFRAWATWAVSLEYERAPVDEHETWAQVEQNWRVEVVQRQDAAGRFASVECYYRFAFARALRRGVRPPEAGWPEFERALSVLSSRRQQAHSVGRVTPKQRDAFVDLVNRWFDLLIIAIRASGISTSRRDAEALLERLPYLDENFEWVW